MNAAHLGQTLDLPAAELGLGALVTVGIDGRDIEDRLCVDGVEEEVLAVRGCGPRSALSSPPEPEFTAQHPAAS